MNQSAQRAARSSLQLNHLVLYLTVTITGAAMMIIELLGTRIIGPFYGVSRYVCRPHRDNPPAKSFCHTWCSDR